MWLAAGLSLALALTVPPIDDFQLPEKLYRYFPDPSRTIVDGSLHEDVMEWQRFEIEFARVPRVPVAGEPPPLAVTGADGVEYECVLPVAAGLPAGPAALPARADPRRQHKWLEALAPLRRKTLVLRAGWWVYEFAYQKHVKQYHELSREEKVHRPAVDRDEFLLGRYVPGVSSETLDASATRLVQTYSDGDVCVLPGGVLGRERHIQVNFRCDPSSPIDHIEEVVEISTCVYVMTVATPRVCRFAKQPKTPKPVIRCHPTRALAGPPAEPAGPAADTGADADADADAILSAKKRQHIIIRHVAKNVQFPLFQQLVDELLTDMGDLFEDFSIGDKTYKMAFSGDDDDDDSDSTETEPADGSSTDAGDAPAPEATPPV